MQVDGAVEAGAFAATASDMLVDGADVAQSVQAEAAWPNAEQSEAEKEDGMEEDESGQTAFIDNSDGGLPLFFDEDKNDEDAGVDAEHRAPVEAGNGVKGKGLMAPARAPAPVPSPADGLKRLLEFGCAGNYWKGYASRRTTP